MYQDGQINLATDGLCKSAHVVKVIQRLQIRQIVISMALLLLAISCSTSNCHTDKKFINQFKSNIKTLKYLETGAKPISPEDYGRAIMYLYKITGILSRADYSSTLGYRNEQYYHEDLQKFGVWLENNKCKYNTALADSLVNLK